MTGVDLVEAPWEDETMAQRAGIPKAQWPARRKEWAQHLAEWATGGLSQAEYCRRRNLDETTFSGWKRRLDWARKSVGRPGQRSGKGKEVTDYSVGNPLGHRADTLSGKEEKLQPGKRKLAVGGAQMFVPLRVVQAESDADAILAEVVLRNGRVLRVGTRSDPAAVGRLAAALERDGVPC